MKYIAAGLGILTLTACDQPQIAVKKQWTDAVRNFALTAVYPMREDVFVGTLRLSKIDDDDSFELSSRSLGYVDLTDALLWSEKAKPTFPKPQATIQKNDEDEIIGVSWQHPEATLGEGSQGNRLRLAALPAVSLVRLVGGDAQYSSLVGSVTALFERQANLDISLLGIQTMELDDVTASGIMRATLIDMLEKPGPSGEVWRSGICASSAAMDSSLDETQVTMITRVFYANGIEYNYGSGFEAAVGGATEGTDLNLAVAENVGGDEESEEETNGSAALIQPPTAPGLAAKLITRARDSLVQSEIFERPLAFGVSGISIRASDLGFTCDSVAPSAAPIASGGFGAALTTSATFDPVSGIPGLASNRSRLPKNGEQTGQGALTSPFCNRLTEQERQEDPDCAGLQ